MNIGTKLTLGFISVAAMTLVVAGVGERTLQQSMATQRQMRAADSATRQAVDCARSAQVVFKQQVQEWKDILLRGSNTNDFQKHFAGFTQRETETHERLVKLQELLPPLGLPVEGVSAALQAHTDLGIKYRDALKSYVATNPQSAQVVDKLVKGLDRPLTKAIDGIVTAVQQQAEASDAETQKKSLAQAQTAQITGIVAAAAGVLAAVTLGLLLSRHVTRSVRAVTTMLQESIQLVAGASSQVSVASQSLAQGASEQAASLEETSSSLEEMSSLTRHNAENARKANDLARQTRAAAETGAAEVQGMSQAMSAIKTSNDDVAKIIKTIDEIAFQTNLLALNAAVEAARAGQAGAGFAVVANEVRNLAQRSAQAAKETAERIENALSKTAQGVSRSAKVTAALQDIVSKSRQVDELVGAVAEASGEQAQGISQVNAAVTQMDKVTQSNAASAEENASAAEELSAQAEAMTQAVQELTKLAGAHSAAKALTPRQEPRPHVQIQPGPPARQPAPQALAKGASSRLKPEVEPDPELLTFRDQ